MANGTLKVQNIETSSGSGTITLGQNGETIALGATTNNLLTPAFEAYLSADQTGLSDNTYVKCQLDTEVFDTDNCYDNSTNYRFTPTVAGKYFVYGNTAARAVNSNQTVWSHASIYKNGSVYRDTRLRPDGANDANNLTIYVSAIIDMNGSTDYVELFANVNTTDNLTWRFDESTGGTKTNFFGAYRLI